MERKNKMRRKIKAGRGRFPKALAVISLLGILAVGIMGISVSAGSAKADTESVLIPGGDCIGVQIETPGVLVIGLTKVRYEKPAEKAGIFPGDLIVKVNGEDIGGAADFVRFVEENGEKPIRLTVFRVQKTLEMTVTPEKSENGVFRIGIFVRDSAAGIGTITFTNPENHRIAGLGHGVFEPETGLLVPLKSGTLRKICLDGVSRSKAGTPGELKGWLGQEKFGTIDKNTEYGIFGTLACPITDEIPPVPAADFSDLHEGRATMICTTPKGKAEYEVTITEIFDDSRPCKNFIIEVTDPALLEETGGIVQGMSGSPVLQDGKLVGALTHVLVKEPTKGYGIYIGNMLKQMAQ